MKTGSYTFTTPTGYAGVELTQVSQIVAAETVSPPMHWSYDYTSYTVPVTNVTAALLSSISVPSPTGAGLATARLTYDSQGRVATDIDANGNIRTYTYSNLSTLVQTKDPQGNLVLSYTQNFDAQGRDTGTTDAASKSTFISYKDPSNPYQATSIKDEMGRTATTTYDGYGNMLTSTSPRGIVTTYAYNYANYALGRLVQVQEGSKPPVSMSYYEPSGLPQTMTAPSPTGTGTVSSSFTYDALGNLTSVTTPGVTTTSTRTTTYNYTTDGTYTQAAKAGQPLTITDALGNATHFRYDARGNVVQSWDALGNTTDIAYNLADQPTDSWAPATNQTGIGRTRTSATYLYVGGPATSTRLYDESGVLFRTVSTSYGAEGETLASSGDTTAASVTYDALYRTKTLTDALGRVTTYTYDTLGRISMIAYPGAVAGSSVDTISYTSYDASGLLLQSVDGRGRIANYTYNDAEGQLTTISYPSSPGENVSYVYDAYGLPQSVTDASGTRSYTLNTSDVLTQVSTIFKKIDGTFTSAKNISYTYNADGSRASMTTPAGTFAYNYDSGGRWTSLQDHKGNVTSWNYDALNRLTKQTLTSNVTTNFTYNAMSQMVGLTNRNNNGALFSKFGHESDPTKMLLHNAAGDLTREVADFDGFGSGRFYVGTTTYSYDNKSQLISESSTRNSGFNNSFAYDAMGNPTSWKDLARTFNLNNQETTGGAAQFAYDGNGNATKYKSFTATYDENDKLTSLTTSTGFTSTGAATATPTFFRATYRADGLRAWKTGNFGTTYYLYDGDHIVCELNSAGSLNNINEWGANGLLGRQNGTNPGTPVNWFLWDDRGNIANGGGSADFIVSAWGDVTRNQGSPAPQDPYFTLGSQYGNCLDLETGLTLCGQRYYDSSGGRWLTRDPIGTAGGLNVYGYCGNNPTNRLDSSGLKGVARIFFGAFTGSGSDRNDSFFAGEAMDEYQMLYLSFIDKGYDDIKIYNHATAKDLENALRNPKVEGIAFYGHGNYQEIGMSNGDCHNTAGDGVTPDDIWKWLGGVKYQPATKTKAAIHSKAARRLKDAILHTCHAGSKEMQEALVGNDGNFEGSTGTYIGGTGIWLPIGKTE